MTDTTAAALDRGDLIEVEFTPQAWIGDTAYPADPDGDTCWLVGKEEFVELTGKSPDEIEDDNYESDRLRESENAPQWVKDWSGPFAISVVRG